MGAGEGRRRAIPVSVMSCCKASLGREDGSLINSWKMVFFIEDDIDRTLRDSSDTEIKANI